MTPLFRHRLDEKFKRGAENQAFLVESVTGVETLKAMAVEPQMQRRWEEQLAAYVARELSRLKLRQWASQAMQLINKLVTAAILFFGAKPVIDGHITVGELVAFNMLAGRVSAAGAAAGPDLAGLPSGAALDRAPGRHPQHPARAAPSRRARTALPAIKRRHQLRACDLPLPVDGPEVLHDVNLDMPAGQVVGIVGPSGSGKSTLPS